MTAQPWRTRAVILAAVVIAQTIAVVVLAIAVARPHPTSTLFDRQRACLNDARDISDMGRCLRTDNP